MKLTTLCFLIRGDEVLLAMKKRGFGIGKWNGVGGKVEEGETLPEAAVREAEEEIGVEISPENLKQMAILRFFIDGKPEWDQTCHVFEAKTWRGKPAESEEMKPRWFSTAKLPFKNMWPDDPFWLPLFLSEKTLEAKFHLSGDGKSLLSREVKTRKEFSE